MSVTSAYAPRAATKRTWKHFAFVPIADSCSAIRCEQEGPATQARIDSASWPLNWLGARLMPLSRLSTTAARAAKQDRVLFAEFERAMIQERVRVGLARAKSEGKRLGRPRIAPELEERIRKALATPGRPGVRQIAERFGVDPGTVQRISRPRHPVGVL
jgi:hypothetical protein